MTLPKRKFDNEQEELENIFAAVFHSFENLNAVAPIQIIKRMNRRGVVFARKKRKPPGTRS